MIKNSLFTIIIIFLVLIQPVSVYGQDSLMFRTGPVYVQKEIGDIIREALHKPPKKNRKLQVH